MTITSDLFVSFPSAHIIALLPLLLICAGTSSWLSLTTTINEPLLIQQPISRKIRAVQTVVIATHSVTVVALYGVKFTAFDVLDDASVIDMSVSFPVEEDDVAGLGRVAAVSWLEATGILEPLHASLAIGVLGNSAALDVAALIGTPTHETGTPLHATGETVPRPVRSTAGISDLGGCYFDHVS